MKIDVVCKFPPSHIYLFATSSPRSFALLLTMECASRRYSSDLQFQRKYIVCSSFSISQPAIYIIVGIFVKRVLVEHPASLILLLIIVVTVALLAVLDLLEALFFAR